MQVQTVRAAAASSQRFDRSHTRRHGDKAARNPAYQLLRFPIPARVSKSDNHIAAQAISRLT
jgi:hypothetical protein